MSRIHEIGAGEVREVLVDLHFVLIVTRARHLAASEASLSDFAKLVRPISTDTVAATALRQQARARQALGSILLASVEALEAVAQAGQRLLIEDEYISVKLRMTGSGGIVEFGRSGAKDAVEVKYERFPSSVWRLSPRFSATLSW